MVLGFAVECCSFTSDKTRVWVVQRTSTAAMNSESEGLVVFLNCEQRRLCQPRYRGLKLNELTKLLNWTKHSLSGAILERQWQIMQKRCNISWYNVVGNVADYVHLFVESGSAICTFFLTSTCSKGSLCPFRHIKGERAVVCKHWLRGLCKKGDDCEFLHEFDMTKMPECYFFSRFGKRQLF